MADPELDLGRDLTQTEIWLRDTLMKLSGWGLTVILLLAGWTVGKDDAFSFDGKNPHALQAAWALSFCLPTALLIWSFLLIQIRCRCPDHLTIPPKRAVVGYIAIVVALAASIFWMVISD